MHKIPAITGWLWIKQGFALFRKQPGGLSTLFVCYLFPMLLISHLPFLGPYVKMLLTPIISVAFMQACLYIELNKRVLPTLLLTGFHKPALPRLVGLGVMYLIVAVVCAAITTALIDKELIVQLMNQTLDPESELLKDSHIGTAVILTILIAIPAAMAFCFAPPLIHWQKMGLGKAIFYSFFAVWRSLKAFLVFALAWFFLCSLTVQFSMLFGNSGATNAIAQMLTMLMVMVFQCSLYASYKHIFGMPAETVSLAKE